MDLTKEKETKLESTNRESFHVSCRVNEAYISNTLTIQNIILVFIVWNKYENDAIILREKKYLHHGNLIGQQKEEWKKQQDSLGEDTVVVVIGFASGWIRLL